MCNLTTFSGLLFGRRIFPNSLLVLLGLQVTLVVVSSHLSSSSSSSGGSGIVVKKNYPNNNCFIGHKAS